MGKATRWFKGLFGFKKSKKEKQNRVSSGYNGKSGDHILTIDSISHTEKEHNNQEIAVMNATVSVAVKAAVKIQSVFRGCLARKALRALRGLVKIQAIVRGYLVRKRAAEMLNSIQALIRVQNSVRSKRINRYLNTEYNMFQPRPSLDMLANEAQFKTSQKIAEINDKYSRSRSSLRSKQVHNVVAMSEYGKNLEMWKFAAPISSPIRQSSSLKRATAKAAAANHQYQGRFFSEDGIDNFRTSTDRYYVLESPENGFWTYEGSMTPSYMGKTQSFKAKLRSHSTPRQRLEKKRLSLDEEIASKSSVSGLSKQSQRPRFSCSYDSSLI